MPDLHTITLFLSGDVMTGRGIDQVLPCPGDPFLYQSNRRSAGDYLKFAEKANGPIQKPVDFSYIWGDAIKIIEENNPDLKMINLETTITQSNDFMIGKAIHYRMHPGNIFCLTAANINICTVGNNHVLDMGYEGLKDTIQNLKKVNIGFAGAGDNLTEAELPEVMSIPGKGRVIVFSYCSTSSGVPLSWGAEENKFGVNLITDLSAQTVQRINDKIKDVKKEHDIVVFSIHWGTNWSYEVPDEQRNFAHELIDKGGVDIIFGHSSHHPRPIEVYKDKLIVYGAGDLINDYEGILKSRKSRITLEKLKNFRKYLKLSRKKKFRHELVLMYFVTVEASSGKLKKLKLVPMKIKNFRLSYPLNEESEWMIKRLNAINKKYNSNMYLEFLSQPGETHKNFSLRRQVIQ